jgi:Aspartyl protease
MRIIEWRCEPGRIRLPVLIFPPSAVGGVEGKARTALIDTGSTVSGVSPEIAASLGLPRRGRQPAGSAHGRSEAERYEFKIGLMPDYSPPNQPSLPFVFDSVIGIALPDPFEFDVMIGMDVLGQCDFAMNRRGACRLVFG